MIKVYLLAYLNRNFGDDLFLKILLERYPNIILNTYTRGNTFVQSLVIQGF